MITIKIEADSTEDLKRQMKALGYVPAGEQVITLKGEDLKIAVEKAKPPVDYAEQLRLDGVHPQVESLETDAKDSVSPEFSAEDIKTEEPKTRKRRSKAEIEAEKAAKEAEANAEAETESELEAEAEDDDLAGDDVSAPEINADTIRPMIQERVKNGKREDVVALLTKYGVARFPDLKDDKWVDFYNDLVKI